MNVIWIVSDTLRRDHVGCYGNDKIRTPALDALAAKSVRFDRYYAAGFPTLPTRADHFLGRWSICFMGWEPIPRGQITIAQVLNRCGYQTAAVADTAPLIGRNGMNYDRGFRSFMEIPGQVYGAAPGLAQDYRRAWLHEADWPCPRTFTRAVEWLEWHRKEDFFLYIDTFDPHEPWEAPDYYTELYWPGYDGEQIEAPYCRWQDLPGFTEEMVKKGQATYCGEVTMVDTWVGHLLKHVENMGLMDNTAIIFTNDHGFYFGEHGGYFGKLTRENPNWTLHLDDPEAVWTYSPLYEELVACPLLIYVPGVKPGVYNGLASAVDLMPTALNVMGQQIPPFVEGQSLLPGLQDTNLKGREFVISSHPFSNPHLADAKTRRRIGGGLGADTTVTTEEWSLLYSLLGPNLLFHLPSNPRQEKNVIGEHPDVARELHQLLIGFMRDYNVAPELIESRLELKI